MLKSKFITDFSNIAQGAFSTMNAIREELDVMVKSRLERVLVSKGLVTKEEHDIILLRINNLNMKIDGLEAKIDSHAKQLKELLGTKKNKRG
jgi:BMFP domain-containing protein YqiC